jgi:hypothetical protein
MGYRAGSKTRLSFETGLGKGARKPLFPVHIQGCPFKGVPQGKGWKRSLDT